MLLAARLAKLAGVCRLGRCERPRGTPGTSCCAAHTYRRALASQATNPATPQREGIARADTSSCGSQQPDEALLTGGGSLFIILGPMFAGKTTELIRRVKLEESRNKRVAVINSIKDTRYGENVCATHDGHVREAFALHRLYDLLDQDSPHSTGFVLDDVDVVAIDESQFFPDLRQFCLELVETHGKTVIAAGLSGDFRRSTFGDLVTLVPFADGVELLTARCAFCEQSALFTLRLVANESQQLVGGADAYSPVCRKHYIELNKFRGKHITDDV